MNRTEYKERIQELVFRAKEELSDKDMDILVSMIYSECCCYIRRRKGDYDDIAFDLYNNNFNSNGDKFHRRRK